jgi:ferredoxin
VRLGVVTTSLPLPVDGRRYDGTMIDFCARCSKCADVCPSAAIPFDGRSTIDGVKRWKIDSEACYTLWTKLGTDCGRCVAVCPYSHPDNLLHDLVRAGACGTRRCSGSWPSGSTTSSTAGHRRQGRSRTG